MKEERRIHGEPMNCKCCGRVIPVDEVLWDHYIETGEAFCIDCDPEDI